MNEEHKVKNLQDSETLERSNRVSFPIEGMSCQSCVSRIEGALSGQSGVIRAVVDFGRREARVHFDPHLVTPDALKMVIEKAGYSVSEKGSEPFQREKKWSRPFARPHAYIIGIVAALGVVGFYLGFLTLTSNWHSAQLQFREFGVWIIALAIGLGVQVTLFSLFRSWHGGDSMKGAKCSLATSGGMSTTAMAACCSHYLALVLPALGLPFLSSAAAGLADYQVYFFFAGVLSNLFGIGFMLRLMIRSGMIPIGASVKNVAWAEPIHVKQ
jgi:cation transport ATPase